MDICLHLPLRSSHAGMFSNKFVLRSNHQGAFFQYRCSAPVVNFFEKYLWWNAIFSKFACNALQLWTTAEEKHYFIKTLINAEQQLLQNTSRKLLLCLEAVVCRCSLKWVFLKISQISQQSTCENTFSIE